MPIVSVNIPQIGEGLQEARLVAVLKQPGEFVRRDEPIYQMETDKAVMDVESPFEGTLVGWSAPVDTILPIGAEIATMDVADGATPMASHAGHIPAAVPVAPTGDTIIGVQIPQIGEGLQEARLVAVLKQPGDAVKRDEPIYQMETDKAVMDVESPYEGVLVSWSAPVDTVLPIGAEVAKMKVGAGVQAAPSSHAPVPSGTTSSAAPVAAPSTSGARRLDVPPRTRAYAKENGVSEDQLASIPAAGSKLLPSDIDAFLAGGTSVPAPPTASTAAGGSYQEVAMPGKQRLLASRLVRGSQLVVPGTIMVATKWAAVESARAAVKASGGDFQPSAFTMFSFAVAKALKDFPAFRTTLVGDSTLRCYDRANLGIAVALPGDELVLAVVEGADHMDWRTFADSMRARIDLARGGQDQANESVTISLTNMQAFGLRDAVPVVVPPGVATLFLGEPYNGLSQETTDVRIERFVNLALTFDHRLINGVGASEFINAVKKNVEGIGDLLK